MKRKMQPKLCPKCGSEHTKTGVYCSRSCANSRKFTGEARQKKSTANRKYWESLSEAEQNQRKELLATYAPHGRVSHLTMILSQDWDVLGIQGKRLRVILEQQGKCKKCGLSEWNSEPITLEFEHKDGNNGHNERENVEVLCPNCHSQTPTWRGRKNKKRQRNIEEYLKLI